MPRLRCSPVASSAALGLAGLLLACGPKPEPAAPTPPAPPPASVPAPSAAAPILEPPLGRPELLAAAAAAADAFAAGQPGPPAAAGLAGRRFRLKLPFGCAGPGPEGAAARYAIDAEKRTLRLSVRPEAWTDAAWARALVGSEETEAIEGFWIRRPWLTAEACPATPGAGAASSPETLGLAQVFARGGSRVLRRGSRPYEATRKFDAGETPGAGGFRLVLEGRVAAPEDRRPVRCAGDGDTRPVCLVLVELDRVAFEDPDGAMLAEWKN